jgi:thymidylate synthase (FAD)
MKVYTRPKVYLIARPEIVGDNVLEFLDDNETPNGWEQEDEPGDGDSLPEFAGRICYVSFGQKQGRKTNREYIGNILKSGHGSVLEHANFTFLVTQCSRGFTHEMVRHRAGFAYSQESTHYVDYDPETFKLCLDPRMGKGEMTAACEAAREAVKAYRVQYESLRAKGCDKKIACSMARQLLPTGLEAKLVFTANIRALRHFIEARCSIHNVLEIAEVAAQVLKVMKEEAPNCFTDIELHRTNDGLVYASSDHRKV